ncbi:DUF4870 domain-containing protein [Nocardioides sp.]|uniref:DUF4870 domain-containing protein n=1 Tax=Nocardioides sp. TaxID=35761 RepID=UPI002D7EEB3A|nr:DUF4870 domain-containing protein [Nocardioides sp.]HET8959551.1 DUF4870 domain-containing protein [Nocardioides sp.]
MSDPYGPPPPEQPEGETPGQQPPGQQPYGQPPPPSVYGQQPSGVQQPGAGGLTPDERTWGGAAHWSALVAGLFGGLAFLGPLIVMLVKGNDSPWIRRQSVESLNFQISILIYAIVSAILIIVLIGLVLLAAVGVLWLVFTIIGSVKASSGEDYRYPLTIRMVS